MLHQCDTTFISRGGLRGFCLPKAMSRPSDRTHFPANQRSRQRLRARWQCPRELAAYKLSPRIVIDRLDFAIEEITLFPIPLHHYGAHFGIFFAIDIAQRKLVWTHDDFLVDAHTMP
jgi:hypothetical protein